MMALRARKKALTLESDLNRLRLRAEVNNLWEAGAFARKLKFVGRFGKWGWALVPLAGVIGALGLGRSSMAGGVLGRALAAAPAFMRLWRTVSALLAEFK
jgi:hypothetical protein